MGLRPPKRHKRSPASDKSEGLKPPKTKRSNPFRRLLRAWRTRGTNSSGSDRPLVSLAISPTGPSVVLINAIGYGLLLSSALDYAALLYSKAQ